MRSETWRQEARALGLDEAESGLTAAARSVLRIWPTATTRTALLFATGITLGPSGLAILTPSVLELLQPAVGVTLVVLGVILAVESLSSVTLSRVVPIVVSFAILGAGIAAAVVSRPAGAAFIAMGYAGVISVALAGAGWVLSSRGAANDERRIFSIATFLLLGGVAEYLAVPAFLLGWMAAVVWRPLRPADLGAAYLDAAYVQGPASALLLILAGAHVQFSWLIALPGVAVAVLSRTLPGGSHLLAAGISLAPTALLAALLMDAARLHPGAFEVLSVLVMATLIALLLPRPADRRP